MVAPFINDEYNTFTNYQFRSATTLVFGRKTFEGMAVHLPTASGVVVDLRRSVQKIVFSRTLKAQTGKIQYC